MRKRELEKIVYCKFHNETVNTCMLTMRVLLFKHHTA